MITVRARAERPIAKQKTSCESATSPPPSPPGQWLRLLPLCAVLLLVFLLGCHELADSDLWWHLRTAQLMVDRGAVPRTDWFAYSSPNARWINLNWLWELAADGLWQLTGVPGLIVATSGLGALTFVLLLWDRGRVSASIASLLAVPPILLFATRFPVRPESMAFFCLSASLFICHRARQQPRLVWLLPAVQMLWVNCHGSFIVEIVVVGCFAIDAVIGAVWNLGTAARRVPSWRVWSLVCLACLGACLVNPYGIGSLKMLMLQSRLMGTGETARFYQQLATELYGFEQLVARDGLGGLESPSGFLLLGTTFLAAASFVPLLWMRKRIEPSRVLLTILFIHLGWQTFKNMPFFALTALAVALWNLNDGWDGLPRWLTTETRLRTAAVTAVLLLLALCVPTNAYYGVVESAVRPRSQKRFGLRERPAESPHAEALFLGRPDMPQHVFANDHSLASAYIFHNGPERKVYVDGRLEVSKRECWERYFEITDRLVLHDPKAEEMLLSDVPPDAAGKREMPAVMLQIDDFLGAIDNLVDHPRWRPVFYGDAAIVFLYEPDAARRRIPSVDREKLRIDLWRRGGSRCDRNRRTSRFQLGLALRHTDPIEAERHFRRAWRSTPSRNRPAETWHYCSRSPLSPRALVANSISRRGGFICGRFRLGPLARHCAQHPEFLARREEKGRG